MSQLFLIIALLFPPPAQTEYCYQGKWVTTNRSLDGIMDCKVKFSGKTANGDVILLCDFSGVWQGVSFQYDAKCKGTREKLIGSAVIDGAPYSFAASISNNEFNCNFNGRYLGSFKMKRMR